MDIRYTGEEAVQMNFALRIPGRCRETAMEIPEKFLVRQEDGYCFLTGSWETGDRVSFTFPMEPVFYQADSRVREDIGPIVRRFTRNGPL